VRLGTIRGSGGTQAVRIDGERAIEVPGAADLGQLLADADWFSRAESAGGTVHDVAAVDFAPLVPAPDKIVCVGLNYRNHILEMGRELPEHPTLFAKFRGALIGAHDDIALDSVVDSLDWEAELAVVIGRAARHVSVDDARGAIAGYSVLNDVSARDWQYRTMQWLQGKTFEHSTPVGPWMATTEEFAGLAGEITCEVNGEVMQQADIGDLLFGPAALVSYISSIITLLPGDVIATGTPGGVGAARQPPRFLQDGDVVTTRIAGLGECRNTCVTS
jgi:acylpyruvate hydrolase